MQPLDQNVFIANEIKNRLLTMYPELLEDKDALIDTLDGLCDFKEAVVAVYESSREDEAMAEAISQRILELKSRQQRFEARSENKRLVIARAMEAADRRKIEDASVTLSLRVVPPSVIIIAETDVPEEFWKEKTIKSIDKPALREALKEGPVKGAILSNGGSTLAARVK